MGRLTIKPHLLQVFLVLAEAHYEEINITRLYIGILVAHRLLDGGFNPEQLWHLETRQAIQWGSAVHKVSRSIPRVIRNPGEPLEQDCSLSLFHVRQLYMLSEAQNILSSTYRKANAACSLIYVLLVSKLRPRFALDFVWGFGTSFSRYLLFITPFARRKGHNLPLKN